MKKSTDNELSRMYSEREVKDRFTIGVAVGIMLTVFVMLMLLVAYHTASSDQSKTSPDAILLSPTKVKSHDDSLADSCGKAIKMKRKK